MKLTCAYFAYSLLLNPLVVKSGDAEDLPTRVQLMYVADATGSIYSDEGNIRSQVTQFFKALIDANPECLVGFSSFWDRTSPTGECYKINSALTTDYDAVYAAVQQFDTNGDNSGDKPEDAWSALYYTTLNAGWADPVPGKKDLKVVVLMTDEGPHYLEEPPYYCGDPNNVTGVGPFDYSGAVNCTTTYPEFDVVANAVIEENICLAVATLHSHYEGKDGFNITVYWQDLINSENPELAKRTTYASLTTYGANIYDALTQAVTDCNVLVPPKACNWHYL